jgi:peptidoglycan lytic transglycosylase D
MMMRRGFTLLIPAICLIFQWQTASAIQSNEKKNAGEDEFPSEGYTLQQDDPEPNFVSWNISQAEILIGTRDRAVKPFNTPENWSVIASLIPVDDKENDLPDRFERPEDDLPEAEELPDGLESDEEIIPRSEADIPNDSDLSEELRSLVRFQIENGVLHLVLFEEPEEVEDFTPAPDWISTEIEPVTVEVPKKTPGIEVYTNKKVKAFIHLYSVKKRAVFLKALERMPRYQGMINRILKKHQLPPNLIYLAVVESNLNPDARSTANAVGLWQFMSYTGKHYGLHRSWWHDDRYDPEMSTESAARYLKRLHKQFKGDWELALAAYNSGSGTVRRAIRRAKASGKSTDFWSLRLPRETRGYVPAFYAVATIFNNLEQYGFEPLQVPLKEQQKQFIDVGGGITLKQLAEVLNFDAATLAEMNPRLRFRGLTPPTFKTFDIALPAGFKVSEKQHEGLNHLKQNKHQEWKIHKVRQGDTLWLISRQYRIPMTEILAYNRLRKKSLLRIGQKLMLPIPSDWTPPKLPSYTKLAIDDLEKLPGITHIHIVKKGETLWKISQKYDIPVKKIREWNRRVLKRKYLKIGTRIVMKLPLALAN